MAGGGESAYVQVLGIELDINRWGRLEGRMKPLIGQVMGRVSLLLAVENEDPIC